MGRKYSGNSIFATKLICEDCGAFFGPKVWNSTSEKYRRTIWQCNDKFKGKDRCKTPHVTEESIKDAFVQAFNILFDCKPEIIANCRTVAEHLTDCNLIDEKIMNLKQEQEVVAELTRKCISENASLPQDQKKYLKKYNDYAERFESISVKLADLNNEKILKKSRRDAFNKFLKTLSEIDGCIEVFDDELWLATVDKVIIKSDGEFKFIFRNEMEIEVMSTK